MTRTRNVWALGVVLAALAAGCRSSQPSVPKGEWKRLKEGSTGSFSGCAVLKESSSAIEFLVVHDSKKNGEPRIGEIDWTQAGLSYTALAWPAGAPEPVDLESISALPGRPGRFVALASGSKTDPFLYTLEVKGGAVTLVSASAKLPTKGDHEGFRLTERDGRLFALWAERGYKEASATLYWGPYDVAKGPTVAGSTAISVPFPGPEYTRDVSDLEIDGEGTVFATAAWDEDNDKGPFRSAAYELGVLRDPSAADGFNATSPPRELARWEGRKAEALVLTSSGELAFASDDEDLGGWFLYP